jgi:peptidase M48-like protein
MHFRAKYLLLAFVLTATCFGWPGKKKAEAPNAPPNPAFDRVVQQVVTREAANLKALRQYSPLVESYMQSMKPDADMGMVPISDQYYLHRVAFGRTLSETSFHPEPGFLSRAVHGITKEFRPEFVSQGFTWMIAMDMRGLDREHYNFDYQGREFLGDLRCIIMDVTPKRNSGKGRFLGRIWVEDKDYNIVRFNGTFTSGNNTSYLHFDTWRLNMAPGIWLPAYVYSEDMAPEHAKNKLGGNYKAETRIWGYNVGKGRAGNEFTEVLVDDSSANAVKDNSDKAQDMTPVAALRTWQRQAEDNVIERLQTGGLVAKTGEVDKVLNTVINNLQITNNLDIQPEVRCRVLLTSPLESFTFGHTIFVSRGMLDVLPDEASLAAVLAHELSHIVLGHPTDTTFAFKDRSIVGDQRLLARMHFKRTLVEEQQADTKAVELLNNSPYKDKLDTAGLFLRQVDSRRRVLPHLIRSDMGNSLFSSSTDLRMQVLIKSAPKLEPRKVSQVAALPLGGRIRVDPWNDTIEINKAKPVALLNAREKMPLEVAPMFPHLTRYSPQAPAGIESVPAQGAQPSTPAAAPVAAQAQPIEAVPAPAVDAPPATAIDAGTFGK